MQATDETPYALALRLSREGAAAATIDDALKARGLMPDEVATVLAAMARHLSDAREAEFDRQAALIEDDPLEQALRNLKRHREGAANLKRMTGLGFIALGVLMLMAMVMFINVFMDTDGPLFACGLIGTGIMRVIASFVRPKQVPQSVVLAPEDASPRCADHPMYKSVGVCPRCGSLRCHDCAPDRGFTGGQVCLSCTQTAAFREEKLRAAWRRVSLALFACATTSGAVVLAATMFPKTFAATTLGIVAQKLPLATCAGLLALPFLILGALQVVVRHPWPALVSLPLTAFLTVVLMELGNGSPDASMTALGVPVVVVVLLLPEHWSRYSEARSPTTS